MRSVTTTRTHPIGRKARHIEIDVMNPEEGALFLLRRAGCLELDESLTKATTQEQTVALYYIQGKYELVEMLLKTHRVGSKNTKVTE